MTRALVVGAGISGLVSAWTLHRAGLDVTVYDAGAARPWCSPVAAGMLAPAAELSYGESALHDLAVRSLRGWPSLAAELLDASGVDVGLREEGTLVVAVHRDDDDRLRRHADLLGAHGSAAERLDGTGCLELEPALTPATRGGLLLRDDVSVDNRATLRALRTALDRGGVRVCEGAVTLAADVGRVDGVRREDGATDLADLVVLCAGVSSGELAAQAGLGLAVRPVKGELLRLRTTARSLRQTVRAVVDGVPVYLVPRADGEVVVGATTADAGPDLRRTPRAALDLLGAAVHLVPELRDAEIVSHDVGLRPGTPDNGPYLGPCDVRGLVVATGHFRHGFLLAPATAEVVRAVALGQEPPAAARAFDPHRHDPDRHDPDRHDPDLVERTSA